jgi:photosystem II Psb27 protein
MGLLPFIDQVFVMKRFMSRLLAFACALLIGLVAVPSLANADSLTGQYKDDVVDVIGVLKEAIDVAPDNPEKGKIQAAARVKINDFASRYRRNGSVAKLSSFTTMRTALNSLAAHYSAYPNRPVSEKMKTRLLDEFKQVEIAMNRGN